MVHKKEEGTYHRIEKLTKEKPEFLSPRIGLPLLLIPEYSGINKEQKIPDRSKTAHRKPPVKMLPDNWQHFTRLLHPWNFPGNNTGVISHFLLQGIFPTKELNPNSCISCIGKWILYQEATWEAYIYICYCIESVSSWNSRSDFLSILFNSHNQFANTEYVFNKRLLNECLVPF